GHRRRAHTVFGACGGSCCAARSGLVIALTLAELANATRGRRVAGDALAAAIEAKNSVRVDSRLVTPGDVFVCQRGESADGHDFAAAAVEAGAAVLIVERPLNLPVPQVQVEDAHEALQELARVVVARVRDAGSLRVVAITGSNGKTTTKNMVREILGRVGQTVAPEGSFNNYVGAPLSMLGVTDETRFLVVE